MAPAPALRPYVRSYRFFDLDASRSYTVPAWTRTMMLFRYGDFFYAYFPDGTAVPHLGASLFGATTRPLAYGGGVGRYRFAAVEFRPLAMHALLRENVARFTDGVIDATAVYGDREVQRVAEQLCEARTVTARAAALDAFFAPRLGHEEVVGDPEVGMLLVRIGANLGPLSMQRLTKEADLSERTLRRRFSSVTGLSPQLYHSILRAERALGWIYHRPEADAAEIVHACGFSDQPHLIHELRRFASATPGTLRRNAEAGPAPLREFFPAPNL